MNALSDLVKMLDQDFGRIHMLLRLVAAWLTGLTLIVIGIFLKVFFL